ncbi:hypothetical protein A9Q86_08375 [Flavobacteriales bacterium 33_180_T64]|nr:hypothetical protein A9Q86_08375 [Flavobacteriales bacterium 33_180_T64]
MKRLQNTLIFLLLIVTNLNAQVGIGTTTPNPSSALDITSTDSGILVPRMLVSERIAISAPANGLLVYQTDDVSGFYFYNSSQWVRLLDNSRDSVPTAAIFAFPTAIAPTGYLICDGSAVSRTTYADLFAVIGVIYGNGNGSTTFNLPDYRGEFLRGFDNGAGNDPDAISRLDRGDGVTGDAIGTKQTGETNSHLHNIAPPDVASSTIGGHQHITTGFNANTTNVGNHNHNGSFNGTTNSAGAHNHRYYFRNVDVEDPGAFDADVTIREVHNSGANYVTSSSPSHTHTISGSINVNFAGSHSHNVSIPTRTSNTGGIHNHTVSIPAFDSATHGGNETRPTNVSVTWCIKY